MCSLTQGLRFESEQLLRARAQRSFGHRPAHARDGHRGLAGILAPVGTSDDVVEAVGAHIRAIVADPQFRPALAAQGRIWTLTPAQFAARVSDETSRYGELVKRMNIKVE